MKKTNIILFILTLIFGILAVNAQIQGTLDNSFLPDNDGVKGANNAIFDVVQQADGKIIIGGWFSEYNGIEKNRLVRINQDGSMDESFNQTFLSSTGNTGVTALALQPDGKLLVGGNFDVFVAGNLESEGLLRLNPDGSIDTSFLSTASNLFCSNEIYSISVQPDGKIILAGDITFCLGNSLENNENILRLNPGGTIDQSFAAVIDETGLPGNAEIYKTIIQPDGKILVSGYFNESNGISSPYLTRLNSDGSNDTSFSIGTGFDDDVNDIALQPDGKILVVGDFDNFNGAAVSRVVRLNADGSLDTSFNVGVGPQNQFSPGSASSANLESVSIQSDGKIIVAGGFNLFDGVQISQVARLNNDGSLEASYNNSIGVPSFPSVLSTTILNDGNMLLSGAFSEYQFYKRGNIVKLNSTGSIDFSFNQNFGPSNGTQDAVIINAIKPSGSGYYVAGQFNEYDNELRKNIAKINNDGSLDTNFSTGTGEDNGFDDDVFCMTVQPNNKVVVGGDFDEYNGNAVGKIARLNADGSLDASFTTGSGFNSQVNDLALQPDGKIIAAGNFFNYNGTTVDRLARLNPDGTLDSSFSANISFTPNIITQNENGKLYVGGTGNLIRLNGDGSLDNTFNFSDSAVYSTFKVNDIIMSNNNVNVFVAGYFSTSFTAPRKVLLKLNLDGSTDSSFNLVDVDFEAFSVEEQSDGKLIIGGSIENVTDASNSINRDIRGLIRLHADGTFDDAFNPDQFTNEPEGIDINANFYGEVKALQLDNNGRLIVGGQFNSYNAELKLPLIAVEAFNDVQNFINIPDPNFEQALIDLNIDSDGIINGQMLESDALGVVDLDVSSKNISDLTGIEFFTDLETLSAFNNNLTGIDLSQNTNLNTALLALNNLTSIDFSNNPDLISISLNDNNLTSIDLSNNTALLQVFVNNNNLNSIDVSMLSNLENLGVSSNNLTNLDVSQNANLFTLFCNDNQLQSLNVQNENNTNFTSFEAQNNPNLTCISVDDVNFSNTNWLNATPQFNFDTQSYFSPDCSNLISIPDPNFEQALIDLNIDTDMIINGVTSLSNVNGVTTLDVSNKNISDLTGIEFFNNLQFLTADNNSISTLVLDQNTQLITVGLFQNQLSSIVLPDNNVLSSIDLGNNLLTQIDLSNNLNLSSVFVNDNLIDDIDVSMLSNLNILDVSGNNLTQLDLSPNTVLSQIDVSGNNLINFNLQNGNNTSISDSDFDSTNNTNLTCIEVDDPTYSFNTWFNKDPQTDFSSECEPDNDDCIDAPLLAYNVPTPGTTFSSTPSGLDPSCQQSGITIFDVWYKLEGPASGIISISINGGGLLKVAVYDDCMAALPIACGIDGILVDNLIPGVDYFIQVWVDAGTSGLLPQNDTAFVGDFTIEITEETMSNTDFENSLEFSFYPNPASHYLTLESSTNLSSYQIFDINGKEVMAEDQLSTMKKSIDVNELSSGIYLLKVNGLQSSSTQKLIIK
jgi:uncharacterized delta-60 repeat protein